ncbi:3' terminal RNA ribose 2'-O-methyltransferase Hen1 [Filimonas lacunae]|uniref:Small RNA 2'-O-methyltransferase n=1 Tax=Filimonas lacunae TaxID=477680 RepID=A0A173MCU8_9BACT|nr:3' terminal RNA ribose 2'-O-methyltransferase Hen1 [Filimonas lacunae]BAV05309.1 methyltransferase type 12 [Filimonas lacunae]SIT22057.1 3' terminal RNA ribose 2'-O-methyltransferase Hen1 [Filimonas lacunae]
MLLTVSTTRYPATDLSYMLHKHPAKVQQTEIKNGVAHIFYPAATDECCTCALLLDIDPVALVRGDNPGNRGDAFALEQYVNDRPYTSSSLMSTAIARAFSTALNGKCKDKPELVPVPMPFTATVAVVPVRGGRQLLEKLFLPLGYTLHAEQHILDAQFPEWGDSRYFTITLSNTITLQALLTHLYVLIPVLDNDKHYWVSEEEVQKLLDKGKGWLETHPEKDLIVRRYLKHQTSLMQGALDQLMNEEQPAPGTETEPRETPKIRLHDVRLQTVCDTLLQSGATSVADMGCGEGKLLKLLLKQQQFTRIAGVDVSVRSLEIAADKLKLDKLPEKQRNRMQLLQGSVIYRDRRLDGYDAAALVEVIEHLEPDRLPALMQNLFGVMAPATVLITTPNKDWNSTFTEDTTKMRHSDHRFEWTRAEFTHWCTQVCDAYAYHYTLHALGEETEQAGAPSQMAVFTKQPLEA